MSFDEKYEPPEASQAAVEKLAEAPGPSPPPPLERVASQTYNYGAPGTMEPHGGTGLSLVESSSGHKHQHQYLWKRLAKPLPLPSKARYNVMM